MATTATVLSDAPQADGRRRIMVEFDTGTGFTWLKAWFIASGAIAQDEADAAIPRQDAIQKELEREDAYFLAANSGDPDLETYFFNTLAEIQKYVFRRLFNLMRDEVDDPTKANVADLISVPAGYLNKHSNPVISGFIDDPAWTTPVVNAASGNISAVGLNIRQLDHGEDELSLDF